jgi:hypothetical protein
MSDDWKRLRDMLDKKDDRIHSLEAQVKSLQDAYDALMQWKNSLQENLDEMTQKAEQAEKTIARQLSFIAGQKLELEAAETGRKNAMDNFIECAKELSEAKNFQIAYESEKEFCMKVMKERDELKKDVNYWKNLHINGNEFIKKLEKRIKELENE